MRTGMAQYAQTLTKRRARKRGEVKVTAGVAFL
jgi:hypothetical protein